MVKFIDRVLTPVFVGFIKLYKLTFSHIFRMGGGRCRFYPDCSSYGLQAIQTHGAVIGAWLTLKRVVKCGPFHEGGVDLVPTPEELNKNSCKHCFKKESE